MESLSRFRGDVETLTRSAVRCPGAGVQQQSSPHTVHTSVTPESIDVLGVCLHSTRNDTSEQPCNCVQL